MVGAVLLANTAKPAASLDGSTVINYQTAFYSLSVSLNILCTIFIAARLWAQHRNIKQFRAASSWSYSSVIAIVVESAALYSICGIIYVPLVVRALPQQFPVTAVIGSLSVSLPYPEVYENDTTCDTGHCTEPDYTPDGPWNGCNFVDSGSNDDFQIEQHTGSNTKLRNYCG